MSSVRLPSGADPQAFRRIRSVGPRPSGIASNSVATDTPRGSASVLSTGGPVPSSGASVWSSRRRVCGVPLPKRRAHDLSAEGRGASGPIVSGQRPRSVGQQSACGHHGESFTDTVPIVNCSGGPIGDDRCMRLSRNSCGLLEHTPSPLTTLIESKDLEPDGRTFPSDWTANPGHVASIERASACAATPQNQNIPGAIAELASAQPSKTPPLLGQTAGLSTSTAFAPSLLSGEADSLSSRMPVAERLTVSALHGNRGMLRSSRCGGKFSREFETQASAGHDTHRWLPPNVGVGAASIAATQTQRPETDKTQGQDFREDVATFRKDLETQRAAAEAQRIEVGMLRQKFDDLSRKVDDTFASVPRRLSRLLQEEQESRTMDMESLRAEIKVALKIDPWSMVPSLRLRNVTPPYAAATSTAEEDASHQPASVELPEHPELERPLAAVPQIIADLQDERISIRLRLAELNAHLQREVAVFGRHVQRIREQSEESLTQSEMEYAAKVSKLEKLVVQERQERRRESEELRSSLESIWNQISEKAKPIAQGHSDSAIVLASPERASSVKDCIRNLEHVPTIYDLVQEALKNQARLFSEIKEERTHRYNQVNAMRLEAHWLQRQVETLSASTPSVPVLGSEGHT